MTTDDGFAGALLVRRRDVLWRSAAGFLALADVDGATLQAEGPAAEVWHLLVTPTSFDALCTELAARFGVDVDRVRRDVAAFIEQLVADGWIERRSTSDG